MNMCKVRDASFHFDGQTHIIAAAMLFSFPLFELRCNMHVPQRVYTTHTFLRKTVAVFTDGVWCGGTG